MTPIPKRAEHALTNSLEPLELTSADVLPDGSMEEEQWLQPTEELSADLGAGGRQVLAIALIALSAVWLGYSAWSAGRTLSGQPLTSPIVAQWLAIAAGPLALFALLWLIFGRTRRKEAERFTRSVIAMRGEAQSLEALLEVLSQRISESRSELTMMAQNLMQLGDDATGKLGGITQQFDNSSERLKRHGEALDRAANRHEMMSPSYSRICRAPKRQRARWLSKSARWVANPSRRPRCSAIMSVTSPNGPAKRTS